jgi:hypothetical protein
MDEIDLCSKINFSISALCNLNSKLEYRNPKQIQNSNIEYSKHKARTFEYSWRV